MNGQSQWDTLDPSGPPRLSWLRPVSGRSVVLLLGAFDPPTLAHLAILHAACRRLELPGAFCLTKVLLDRPHERVLPATTRLALLDAIGAEHGFGLAAANCGTYVDVAEAAREAGVEPVFVIGSDKLPQLEDPSFYPDSERGVARTFEQARFVVVPRGVPVRRPDVQVIEAQEAFDSPEIASISATDVRERMRRGEDVAGLVPPIVAVALRRYTG